MNELNIFSKNSFFTSGISQLLNVIPECSQGRGITFVDMKDGNNILDCTCSKLHSDLVAYIKCTPKFGCMFFWMGSFIEEVDDLKKMISRLEKLISCQPTFHHRIIKDYYDRGRLTSRESSVITLSLRGFSIDEISKLLHISNKTVYALRRSATIKLGFAKFEIFYGFMVGINNDMFDYFNPINLMNIIDICKEQQ